MFETILTVRSKTFSMLKENLIMAELRAKKLATAVWTQAWKLQEYHQDLQGHQQDLQIQMKPYASEL